MCKAQTNGQVCGLAFPSKLWLQKGRKAAKDPTYRTMPGNWQFYCCCAWEYLMEEASDRPCSAAADWYYSMCEDYRGDYKKFPHVGCGATFRPWKRGPSMVCEIQMNGKVWEAFLADITPQALDDQLKKVSYNVLSASFKLVTPMDMLKAIPITMPMTHLATVDGKEMVGVARYPLDAWAAVGNPCFTSEKWAMICMLMAEKGLKVTKEGITPEEYNALQELFSVSSKMANKA